MGVEDVKAAFEGLSIPWECVEHNPIEKVEEGLELDSIKSLGCSFAKNLFIKDKKAGFFLLVVTADRKLDMKKLPGLLGKGTKEFRFADEAALKEKLGCGKGAASPLGVMTDAAGEVTVVLDEELMGAAKIGCHPCQNDHTLALTPDQLKAFLAKYSHEPMLKAPAKIEEEAKVVGKKEGADSKGLEYTKAGNFPNWYQQVIHKSEMIEFYDISGCYILRPWSFSLWEAITEFFDGRIKKMGVKNCYFPMFVSEAKLNAEKDHVEGFAPEVAWVTRSGDGELEQPIAIRPTSETIMYPAYACWIRSHRDLPLLLNQWCSVVRWEFKHPTPFLRTREFLWQEGHTAHGSYEEADKMVMDILGHYKAIYEELLAVPVIKGYKTEKEKFAGGFRTTTVEAYVPATGRAIQGATSHNLGKNFGKMFKIEYEDKQGQKQIPWQTSWGFTTRSIGVMVMVHSDDTGLVLPPRVAPIQVVIVPIVMSGMNLDTLSGAASDLASQLRASGVRVELDDRDNYNPGWKYNYWELKGVPLRLELGPKDLEKRQVRVVRRDTNAKLDVPWSVLPQQIALLLVQMQHEMLERATALRDAALKTVVEWKDFVPTLQLGHMALTPFCNDEEATHFEELVKEKSKAEALAASGAEAEDARTSTSVAAKTLCIPFEQPPLPEGTKCFISGKLATCWVLWGRSY
ncbi:bifunctional aminoacyl-tRNA synthetase [Chrysochromulina tobinii]|uniref:proline--tRNA ligase n=1 Tax=Chrysochromulina tobinii TaxID=1460289 RepID=A0A0M0J8U0_9EUKA|nr:bifunctional aminoacyl-tRNA synthetase [Chrysochromulina tobinii]|eukprot:KOO22648.1 bifunctional aminoacyl-tRNA synthetase [Chrysochromulina sp. CCMP291]